MKLARRLEEIPDYPFARWAKHCQAATERGLDVIRFDAGNPDLPPPPEVIEALCGAARRPTGHGYAGYRGSRELRTAIAAYYARRFGVDLDPKTQILPLIGSKSGIVMLSLAMLNSGDAVLVPDPGYAPYAVGARLAGARTVPLPLREKNGFLPDFADISGNEARASSMLWLNYPNNPTGATATQDDLAAAVAFAKRHDLLLCHDAPYADVWFEGDRPPSILSIPGARDVAVEFNSLSKTFNMAGWRVGFIVGRADVVEALARIESNFDSGMLGAIQAAAAAALDLDPSWVEERNAIYRERLGILRKALLALGLSADVPQATLYLRARLPHGASSEAFSLRLLKETGVSIAPGTFFGSSGEGYVRISATRPTDRVREAAERMIQLGSSAFDGA